MRQSGCDCRTAFSPGASLQLLHRQLFCYDSCFQVRILLHGPAAHGSPNLGARKITHHVFTFSASASFLAQHCSWFEFLFSGLFPALLCTTSAVYAVSTSALSWVYSWFKFLFSTLFSALLCITSAVYAVSTSALSWVYSWFKFLFSTLFSALLCITSATYTVFSSAQYYRSQNISVRSFT